MKEILDPLTMIAGLRLAALISADGVPISLVSGNKASQSEQDEAFLDFHAFSAIAAGWMGDVQRAIGPLSWSSPKRIVLSGTRGALVLCAGPGAVLLVVLEHGVSAADLRVPMDGVVARMQRKLRNMGPASEQPVKPVPALSGSESPDPESLFPSREQPHAVPPSPQSPSPQ